MKARTTFRLVSGGKYSYTVAAAAPSAFKARQAFRLVAGGKYSYTVSGGGPPTVPVVTGQFWIRMDARPQGFDFTQPPVIVISDDPNIPPTGSETPPASGDEPVPIDPPTFDPADDVYGAGIQISFTGNAHDAPDWTRVGNA